MSIDRPFWRGRRVLVTGHTGFKGAWLCATLLAAGADVSGYALEAPTTPNLFDLLGLGGRMNSKIGDVRDRQSLATAMEASDPECILHLAAQSLVREGYSTPVDTYSTNVMGTVHVLDAARSLGSLRSVVVVTSDKCYQNRETARPYSEGDAIGGEDPYSSSKGAAELVAHAYERSFFSSGPGIASARAGNVIGGGDWSKDRLVPDIVAAALRGDDPVLRHPDAVRPWQHVLESLSGYMLLAERLAEKPRSFEGAWNFGPDGDRTVTVAEMTRQLLEALGRPPTFRLDKELGVHEAHLLHLDSTKARERLGWSSRLDDARTVRWTADWYRAWHDGADSRASTEAQIEEYFKA